MASVTVTQAAKLANTSRKTIYAHINKGKLSSRLDKNNARQIDTAELVRVYNVTLEGNSRVTGKVTPEVTQGDVTGNTINLTPEQLQEIIKNAVAEAIKEVMPLLLEHKEVQNIRTAKKVHVEPSAPLTNYLDDISFITNK